MQNKVSNPNSFGNDKFWDKVEPEFFEVYNTIEDDFTKTIFALERQNLVAGGGAWGVAVIALTRVYTPTKDMSHEDAIKFYEDLLEKVESELFAAKQSGNFDEEEYLKIKMKESVIENFDGLSTFFIPKTLKK